MYIEHTHPEYEEGMVEIDIRYSVVRRLRGDKFKSVEYFEDYDSAFLKYKELEKDSLYELVVLNEEQTHRITKICKANS